MLGVYQTAGPSSIGRMQPRESEVRCLRSQGQLSWLAKMVLHSSGLAYLFLLLDLQQGNFTDAVRIGTTLFLLQTLQLLVSQRSYRALRPTGGGAGMGDPGSARRVTSSCDPPPPQK